MRDDFTEIVFILDRSGSMDFVRGDAIGAFNAFVEDQKKLPGDANLTLVLFNHEYEEIFVSKKLKDVTPITEKDYIPAGTTALLDAIGRTIDTVGERLAKMSDEERPAKVAVGIMTDGFENASSDYTRDRIKEMIQHQESEYSWEFFFLGANMDAFGESNSLGIRVCNTMNFAANSKGLRDATQAYSVTVGSYRSGGNVDLSQYDQDKDEEE